MYLDSHLASLPILDRRVCPFTADLRCLLVTWLICLFVFICCVQCMKLGGGRLTAETEENWTEQQGCTMVMYLFAFFNFFCTSCTGGVDV